MATYVVATVDEIPPGQRKIVEVAGRTVGVFNLGGEFFALLSRCPHQGGPLCEGRLAGFVQSTTPGEYHYSRKGEILRCPWHGWEYDIRTGQSWFDPAQVRARAYKTKVELGEALGTYVTVAAPGPVSGSPGQPGGNAGIGVTPVPATPEVHPTTSGPTASAPTTSSHEEGGMPAPRGIQPGPYVAETYPVSIDREYVVVEIRTATRAVR